MLAGCGTGAVPIEGPASVGAPPGIALLETHCGRCHSMDRALEAGGTEREWAATLARHVSRYAVEAVTGLSEPQASAIADYLGAIRPPDPARRPLRVAVLSPRSAADLSQSGAAGPREPRGGPAGPVGRPGEDSRMPAGPDPVLAEGRPGKPLEALDPRVRETVMRGAERWQGEGCAACHQSDVEIRAWMGAFPQVPLFRPEAGVVTLAQAVEHWRRRPDGPLAGEPFLPPGGDDIVSYLAWRADGAPMAPGRAYPLPPAADLERLEAAQGRGRVVAEGAPGRLDSGACGGCHGPGGSLRAAVPEIVGSAATFPRFASEVGRVATLETYLTGHLATLGREDPVEPIRLGPPESPDTVAVVAYLAWLARDRLVDVGRPPGARPRGSAELGREIFELRCGICHDPRAREPGPLGPGLAGLFERARPATGRPPDRDAVVRAIRSGARGMPAFFDLTAPQIEDLVAYLRTL